MPHPPSYYDQGEARPNLFDRTWHAWPIRYQILMPFAGMMLAAVVSVSLLNAWWAATRSQRQIEEQLRGVARTLLTSTFPLTQNVLEQMHGLSGAEFLLADASGHPLVTSGLTGENLPTADMVTQRWQDLRLGPMITLGDEQFFHIVVHADRRGASNEPSLLHILYPERVLRDARRRRRYRRWPSAPSPWCCASPWQAGSPVHSACHSTRCERRSADWPRQTFNHLLCRHAMTKCVTSPSA